MTKEDKKLIWYAIVPIALMLMLILAGGLLSIPATPPKPFPIPAAAPPLIEWTTTASTGIASFTMPLADIYSQCFDIADRSCDVRPPLYGPPVNIKIAATRAHIYFRNPSAMQGNYGMCSYEKETIVLDVTEPLEMMRDTVLHELTHLAIRVGNGRSSLTDATEDEYIEASVPTTLLILQENPELRKWLGLR